MLGSIDGRRDMCCRTCSRYASDADIFFISVHIRPWEDEGRGEQGSGGRAGVAPLNRRRLSYQSRSLELLASVERVAVLEQADIVLADLVDQVPVRGWEKMREPSEIGSLPGTLRLKRIF